MKNKRFLSLITVVALCMSLFANFTTVVSAEDKITYNADFTQLEAKTYGTSKDIIKLDDYTEANLTYAGTTVDSDGTIHLKGSNNGGGAYTNGSYIEFTAPAYGKVKFTGTTANYYIDGEYAGYGNSASLVFEQGQKLQIGERTSASTVTALSFTEYDKLPEAAEYTSTGTAWDFSKVAPAASGKNKPVISGTALVDPELCELQFAANTTNPGYFTIDFDEPIKSDVEIEFDTTGHSQPLGMQCLYFSISNSEQEKIIYLQAHPYSYEIVTDKKGNQTDYTGKNRLLIGGEAKAEEKEVYDLFATKKQKTTHVKVNIDYTARKVTAVFDNTTTFTGDIPAKILGDIGQFKFWSERSKTAAERYITLDNLSVKEYKSTETPAADESLAAYKSETYGTVPSRVKVPEDSTNKPLVIYLCSSARFGTDNEGQLYQAEDFFDLLGDDVILAAPQTETAWDEDALKAYIAAAKAAYNTSKVIVIGQNEGADAAYALALSGAADKIVPVNGTADITEAQAKATTAKVWAFGGYLSDNIENIRKPVNALQSNGVDVIYTEYPFDSGNIASKAAATTGLENWILNDTENTKVVDLVLFAGQSNMAGRGDYADATECLPGHGFEYHPVTEPGVITTMSEPFGKYENNATVNDNGGNGKDRRSGDMVSSFMESYYSVTGVPIVGVQCSRGGTESSWWYKDGGSGTPKDEAIERYNEAVAYLAAGGYTVRNKFMVWCQGETDADYNRGANTWKTNVTKLFTDLKNKTPITNMFIVRIGHCKSGSGYDATKDPRYKAINLAGKELADANDDITAVASFYTDQYFALMRDEYHYYQPAYNSIGEIAGNNTAVTLYEDKGEWIDYPEPGEVVEEVDGVFEITSSDASVDVTTLTMYDNTTYRMYKADGSYETVTATEGKVANTTGGEVTIVPEYKFEFTNQTDPTDKNIAGYVKVAQGSYTSEKGYGLTSDNYSINANGCKADANPIKADLAEGFYDITVYRLGGARADIYSKGKLIANNTTSASAQNRGGSSALMEIPSVKLSEGSVDITFGNLSGSNERIASVKIVRVPEKYRKPVIWIAGDSESSNYYPFDADGDDLDSDKIMITGFGQQLGKVLSDKYSISNYGQPSATVKTWYDECFESVNNLMQSGDTILIDFGINEVASKTNGLTVDEMKAQMELIIEAAKAKNVTPILISPVYNGKYQSNAYFTYKDGTNDMYDFADLEEVACIDINKSLQEYVKQAAAETNTTVDNWKKLNYHVSDNLHLTQHSALLAASYIAAGMKELGYETTDFAYEYTDISSISDGNVRGTETANKRVYSVANAKELSEVIPASVQEVGTIAVNGTTVTVKAVAGEDDEPILIHAVCGGDGELQSVQKYELTFNKNDKSQVTNLSINNGDELYVWISLPGMKPLAKKKTVTEISQSVQ